MELDNSNSCPNQVYSITIPEMYDVKERNYEWQDFQYKLPKKYVGAQIEPVNRPTTPHKTNYLDDLQKQKKKIPAPNLYKIPDNNRPVSGKISKCQRKTLVQAIIDQNQKENRPGPGYYFKQKRPNTADVYRCQSISQKKDNTLKDHYLNQVEFISSEIPGVGQYNLTNKNTKHVPIAKYVKSQRVYPRNPKQNVQTGKFSFLDIAPLGSFQWIGKQKKKKNSNFFGKDKRFIVGSKYQKKPGPNNYSINQKWTDQNNIMKTTASWKSFKCTNVYYG